MNYFSRITADHWIAKNNLEKAGREIAGTMDRRLIPDSHVEAFKNEFRTKIDFINHKFHRCNPLELIIRESHMDMGIIQDLILERFPRIKMEDIFIYIDHVFQMSLFQIKEES